MIRALTAGFIVALLFAGSTVQAQPAAPRSPRNANYQLAVTLEPATRTLRATGRIEWRNLTRRPTGELQFHLYWNAWTDGKSTWMRENAASRPMDRPGADFSRFTLESLSLEPATAQDTASIEQQHPWLWLIYAAVIGLTIYLSTRWPWGWAG